MREVLVDHCPACGKRSRQLVFRERLLAEVRWCQSCFTTVVAAEDPKSKAKDGGRAA